MIIAVASQKGGTGKSSTSISLAAGLARLGKKTFLEEIRRAVKDPGGKTTFVRLTAEEKNRLVDLVYIYKRQSIKTSENELVRIDIGFLLKDHTERGKDSLLAHVIEALNA